MKVSIVVPSYNHAQFIAAAMDSILSQDYDDIEVMVFDGGSTDDTVAVLEGYGDQIRYVSRKDGGQPDAINQGLHRATGEILCYLNSDDIYLPGALSCVVNHFRNNPRSLAAYGEGWHLHEDGSIMERYPSEAWSYPRLLEVCYLCQPAVFWRHQVVERFGVFDDTLQFALDYDYWLRVGREIPFDYLQGSYLAGSRLHHHTKTLKHRVVTHHEILKVVMRHSSSPPYRWLMNFASVVVEADAKRRSNGAMDESRRRALFIKCVLETADQYSVPLAADFLAELEQILNI